MHGLILHWRPHWLRPTLFWFCSSANPMTDSGMFPWSPLCGQYGAAAVCTSCPWVRPSKTSCLCWLMWLRHCIKHILFNAFNKCLKIFWGKTIQLQIKQGLLGETTTTIQIKTNMLGQHEQKCSATGRSSSHLTRLRISLKPHPKFTFQMTGVQDGCCNPLGFLPLGLWLCCFWLSGSVASGVPVAFLYLSLLLCLGPSGRDRGPQAQKPPKLETTNPPAAISASLRAPLAGNGAPIYRKSPSVALPWASSLPLWLSGSAAVAFLSFSPSLLGRIGACKPKSHPN